MGRLQCEYVRCSYWHPLLPLRCYVRLNTDRMKGDSGVESLDAAAVALGPMNRFMTYLRNNERMHVAWCVTGIVGCLLLYGVLQVCTLRGFVSVTHIIR